MSLFKIATRTNKAYKHNNRNSAKSVCSFEACMCSTQVIDDFCDKENIVRNVINSRTKYILRGTGEDIPTNVSAEQVNYLHA